MLLRLFSLLPSVRRLLADLQQAQTDKLILQDRLETALNDRARVWDEMQTARRGELAAMHMLVNIEYQRKYGIVPYPEATHLPPAKDSGGPVAPRMTASQAVEHQIDKVIRELEARHGRVGPTGVDSA